MAVSVLEPHSFTWIFAVTLMFAFLDAYAIGANDVANSFATSVGSRSLKLWQAVIIAIFTEFGGAIALGGSTTGTIKDGIINLGLFDKRQDLLMAAFMSALIGSSSWVMFATRFGWPVSTTHSIVGAIIGVGISGFGSNAVNWQWDGKGVSQIVASWLIAPTVAGILAVIIYLLTREFVFKARDSLRAGIYAIPFYFTVTTFIVVFFITSKNGRGTLKFDVKKPGDPVKVTQGDLPTVLAITGGVSAGVLLFCLLFAVPYFVRRLVHEEKLRWYHLFYVWFVPKQPKDENIQVWLKKTFTPQVLDKELTEVEAAVDVKEITADAKTESVAVAAPAPAAAVEQTVEQRAAGQKLQTDVSFSQVVTTIKTSVASTYDLATKGLFMDVASVQSSSAKNSHEAAVLYDNKTEFLFSFLQVMTASFASFSHGSNDVANAIGPLAAVYAIWSDGQVGKNAPVQTWMLAYGGAAIDLGLALYGWHVMINLGNNLTYHSPSRGFCMELGAALSVLTASFLALPVSTTQCIVGATIGVGLCNGTLKAINWRMVGWSMFSWILTLPVAGILAGLIYALLTRGPNFVSPPYTPYNATAPAF
ncbi:phosphate transporter [Zopfochytrium polystomum]|nr:phosphate transporter [Zopfochytrium polystomum]